MCASGRATARHRPPCPGQDRPEQAWEPTDHRRTRACPPPVPPRHRHPRRRTVPPFVASGAGRLASPAATRGTSVRIRGCTRNCHRGADLQAWPRPLGAGRPEASVEPGARTPGPWTELHDREKSHPWTVCHPAPPPRPGQPHRRGHAVIWFVTNVGDRGAGVAHGGRGAARRVPGCGRARRGPSTSTSTTPRASSSASSRAPARGRGRFEGLRADCLARLGIPLLAFAGESTIDAELTARSTVPAGILTEAFAYLVNGGPANLAHLVRFVADTVLFEGFGFDPPTELPTARVLASDRTIPSGRPSASSSTGPTWWPGTPARRAPVRRHRGARRGARVAVWCYSLRGEPTASPWSSCSHDRRLDVLVTTVLATGGATAAAGTTGGAGGLDGDEWDAGALGAPRRADPAGGAVARRRRPVGGLPVGLGALDVTQGVAIPEFDGRVIGPPLAFNEVVDDGDELGIALRPGVPHRARTASPASSASPCATPAGRRPPAERRVADRALGLPDQAQPPRQRGWPRHARQTPVRRPPGSPSGSVRDGAAPSPRGGGATLRGYWRAPRFNEIRGGCIP